jgi:hypothetical protein
MILTPLAGDELRRAVEALAAQLRGPAAAGFARIARLQWAARAEGLVAEEHRRAAIGLAERLGIPVVDADPNDGFGWDGRALASRTEAYVLLHEVAHFQLAPPARRALVEFGLGAGPETGRRDEADRAQCLFGLAREREEAEASLLGILWEAALRQPALASFLDQNWLEGAVRSSTAAHFAAVFERLLAAGHIDAEGVPRSPAFS